MAGAIESLIHRSGDAWDLKIGNRSYDGLNEAEILREFRKRLRSQNLIRRHRVSVADVTFDVITAQTRAGWRTRHTFGSMSDWIEPEQLGPSLRRRGLEHSQHLDPDQWVSLVIEDVSDEWKRSLDESSGPVEKWPAIVSDAKLFEGLPTEAVATEMMRRLEEVGMAKVQTIAHIQTLARQIAAGQALSIRAQKLSDSE